MRFHGISRRRFLAGTAAAGAAGLIPGPRLLGAAARDGRLASRLASDNNILDPGYMTSSEIGTQKQIFPFLAEYEYGESIEWRPTYYVKSLIQRDATHIDFELTEGLEWSHGFGPVTAADVKYSYERMKETDNRSYFAPMARVDVTGERTGTIVLSQPFTPFIVNTLTHGTGAILSRKAMEKAGGKFTLDIPAICGPYVYKQIPGQRAIFTPNPQWKGPRPVFKHVEEHIISEVKGAELAFEAGEVDVTDISPDTLARWLKTPPPASTMTEAGKLNYMWLGMNTEHPKLKDKRVRRAIQHAVDVDAILQGAYSNTTEKSYGIICPGLIGKRHETRYYHYSPARARQLLKEAGVSDLRLELRSLNVQEPVLAAQVIQANLGKIGITVKVIPMDSGSFMELGQESKGDKWKDLQLWLMRFNTRPDPYEATQWFISKQVGVWNWERWTDPEFDRLFEQGITEMDEEKRARIYVRMQDIMEETGAYVWINHMPKVFIHRDTIRIHTSPSGNLNYRLFQKKT